jgi:hypothetical protein
MLNHLDGSHGLLCGAPSSLVDAPEAPRPTPISPTSGSGSNSKSIQLGFRVLGVFIKLVLGI